MFKKNLVRFILFFSFSFSLSPLSHANVRHEKWKFTEFSPGEYSVYPASITKAYNLHAKNITGKGVKIAIIDNEFHPRDIDQLNKKGCITPSSLQKKLVPAYDDYLKYISTPLWGLDGFSTNQEEINAKDHFDYLNTLQIYHGSSVMRTLHSIAPQAELLPIDTLWISKQTQQGLLTSFIAGVRQAIDHQVDAISLSCYIENADKNLKREYVNILQEAIQKGITLFCSAGNGSSKQYPLTLDVIRDEGTQTLKKRATKKAFNKLKGKGIFFCGSLGYEKTWQGDFEERFSSFAQHPQADTLSHYMVTPAENLAAVNSTPVRGTSFAAPTMAGGFALVKQYAKENELAHASEDLMNIIYQSGHNLSHDIPGTAFKNYKVLNLPNAIQHLDDLLKTFSEPVVPLPTTPTPLPVVLPTPVVVPPVTIPSPTPIPVVAPPPVYVAPTPPQPPAAPPAPLPIVTPTSIPVVPSSLPATPSRKLARTSKKRVSKAKKTVEKRAKKRVISRKKHRARGKTSLQRKRRPIVARKKARTRQLRKTKKKR